ncbi:alpha/beta-hydrolase [Aspergillus ellipticus CBS 707.79]|uniref:Carboxylic ester hydrolase n=1 Tax=Aspergillus ellipticus CBS 707.79 TaxID=1448320 RepID=A0A319D4F4_9EURO|nr:alpha/beta-hydrolase [Aspergillus ellipticus CBS 707.79]
MHDALETAARRPHPRCPPSVALDYCAVVAATEVNDGHIVSESIDCSTSEDCLFLDIWAPANSTGTKLPVLMYTFCGGFTHGSKIQNTPEGLYDLSKDFIFHEGGNANTAVWDVTQALEWVQKYIGAFGGDPDAVTLAGFSAGASQVMFQMTRFSGRAPQLFDRAYIMSPGYVPGAGHHQAEAYWQNVSTAAGCPGGDITCMRSVNFTSLLTTASDVASEYNYQLQPRVDGNIVADTYEAQLYQKRFNFTGPVFPAITDDVIAEILKLYPAHRYPDEGYRLSDIRQSFDLTGKDLALTQALHDETWNSIVNQDDATHGTDQYYYFYSTYSTVPVNGLGSSTSVNVTVARQMQKYPLSFVLSGNPNTLWPNDKIHWPKYGNKTNTLSFNATLSITTDDLANDKSVFWNKALWY